MPKNRVVMRVFEKGSATITTTFCHDNHDFYSLLGERDLPKNRVVMRVFGVFADFEREAALLTFSTHLLTYSLSE